MRSVQPSASKEAKKLKGWMRQNVRNPSRKEEQGEDSTLRGTEHGGGLSVIAGQGIR